MLPSLVHDLRHGLSSLLRRKTFALIAILTVTLGLGANTAVFSIVNALLLRPYAFADMDHLVLLRAEGPRVMSEFRIAPADFADLQRETGVVQAAAAFRAREANLTVNGENAEPVISYAVSPEFFELIGVGTAAGRWFARDEGQPGRNQVAVVNNRLWKRRFASDPNLVGKSIEVDGNKLLVVGVMPAGFDYPPATDLWVPLALTAEQLSLRDAQQASLPTLQVLARLGPDVDLGRAQAHLRTFSARLEQQYPETHRQRSLHWIRLRDEQFAFSGPPFLMLQAAAAFILILATANLLNLFFVRVIERQKELAARVALGASPRRIAQVLAGEIVPVMVVAVTLAMLLAAYGVAAIRDSVPLDYTKWIAGWSTIRVDRNVAVFTLVVGVLLLLGFLACAVRRSSKTDVAAALKEGGRASAAGSTGGKTLVVLVLCQLVFATVLLACTGLLVNGFARVTNLYAALDAGHVVGMRISLPERDYAGDSAVRSFYRQLLEDIAALPGVESVGAIGNPPASNVDSPRSAFVKEGQQGIAAAERPSADVQVVGADILGALRLRVLRGRNFSSSDDDGGAPVALVSRTMADESWPGEDAVGQRFKIDAGGSDESWISVVGVVEDVKQNWWDANARPVIYRPYLQTPRRVMELEVRSPRDPVALIPAMREAVRRLDPSVSLVGMQTLEDSIADSLAPLRILRMLMILFAALAALLAAIGVYAIFSHAVTLRTHEFGIRAAVGAKRVDLLRLVLVQNAAFCAVALVVGLPLAYAVSAAMRSALPGMVGFEALSFFGCALLVALIAMLASLLPGRRAMRVDPIDSLRGG